MTCLANIINQALLQPQQDFSPLSVCYQATTSGNKVSTLSLEQRFK